MQVETLLMLEGAGILLTLGIVWGTTNTKLNNSRIRLRNLEEWKEEHHKEVTDRLARLETKIDILLENDSGSH
jgi:hypothetical protein